MLLKGNATFLRYFFDPGPDPVKPDAFNARAFTPLAPDNEAAESVGWVLFDKPHDTAPGALTLDALTYGERLVVACRVDAWKVDKKLVKRETQKRIEAMIADGTKDKDEIGRAFVKAIERAVEIEERHKTRPKTKIVEIVVDGRRGDCRIFTGSAKMHDTVAALVERTLGAKLTARHPAAVAARQFAPDENATIATALFGASPLDVEAEAGDDE